MNARDFHDWAVGGYVTGRAAKHTMFFRGHCLNMDTRRGRLTAWILQMDQAIRDRPTAIRWWLADQISRVVLRLRGDKTRVFGFYDCARGNRAAEIVENLRLDLIGKVDDDTLRETMDRLAELGVISGAAWIRNDGRQLDLISPPIPDHVVRAAYDVAAWMAANGYGTTGWKLGPVQARATEGDA